MSLRSFSLASTLALSFALLGACSGPAVITGAGGSGTTSASTGVTTGSMGTGGSGGAMCFNGLSGPPEQSCEGYALGMVCGFGDEPPYSCTCTQKGATQEWDCKMI